MAVENPKKTKGQTARRSKDELARDVWYVLNAPLHAKTKRVVVKNAAWAWTTMAGKYKGCGKWTKAAIEQYRAAKPGKRCKGLNHEHAVPIEAIFQVLKSLPQPVGQEMVSQVLEKGVEGVVVTTKVHERLNEKHKKDMPSAFSIFMDTPLIRYQICEIDVLDMEPNWWRAR